jgi:Rps23 Pro-64 3,4-dihydroxylase Tpa1-like proline 4-hydroxylase
VECSREIAIIYYLTKDWKSEFGGTLVDIPTGHEYVPEFNSLIAFSIPRFHEVKAVTCDRPRYSLFGWFLKSGRLYDLNIEKEQDKKDRKVD